MEAKNYQPHGMGSILSRTRMQRLQNMEASKQSVSVQPTPLSTSTMAANAGTIQLSANVSISPVMPRPSVSSKPGEDQGWVCSIPDTIQTTKASGISNEIQPWISSIPNLSITTAESTVPDRRQPCILSNAIIKATELPLVELEKMNEKQRWNSPTLGFTKTTESQSSINMNVGKERSWTSPTMSISTTTAMNFSGNEQKWFCPNTGAEVSLPGKQQTSSDSTSDGKVRPWICDICAFPFKYKNNLLEHIRFFHMKGSVPCNKCNKVFPTSRHLRIHRKNHSQEAGQCPHCRLVFPNTQNSPGLYQQMYKKHLPDCRRCPARISTALGRSPNSFIDLCDVEDQNSVWRCLGCCNSFSELAEYESHMCQETGQDMTDYSIIQEGGPFAVKPMIYDVSILPDPDSPSSRSLSESDFLCIICGVNFENEDQLNLHLYESHQETDQEKEKSESTCIVQPSKLENEETKVIYVCKYCKMEFPELGSMKYHHCESKQKPEQAKPQIVFRQEHEETKVIYVCKYCKMEFPERELMKFHQCKQKPEKARPQSLFRQEHDDSPSSGVVVRWVCKYCKVFFSDKNEMQSHKKQCAESRTSASTPEITPPTGIAFWNCKRCEHSFDDENVMLIHEQQCSKTTEVISDTDSKASEVIVQWVCKYCKSYFPSKEKMRTHKKDCERKRKTGDGKGEVLVKWVCKYCKKDFDRREAMVLHKRNCDLRNKDKSVLSSTESDMSEVLSKELNSSKSFEDIISSSVVDLVDNEFLNEGETVIPRDSKVNETETILDDKPESLANGDDDENVNEIETNDHDVFPVTSNTDENMNEIHTLNEIPSASETCDEIEANDEDELSAISGSDENVNEIDTNDEVPASETCNADKNMNEMDANDELSAISDTDENVNEMETHDDKVPATSESNEIMNETETDDNKNGVPLTNIKIKIKLNHKCNVCGKGFALRKLMKRHRVESHMFKCLKCGRCFGSNSLLWKHCRICRTLKMVPENHEPTKIYTCRKCYRIFREQYKYKIHKGSCKRDSLTEENVSSCPTLSGKKHTLRVHCHKCDHSYTGDNIFSHHFCAKPENVDAFLDCVCGMTRFSTVTEFYAHWVQCSNTDMSDTSNDSPMRTRPPRLLCQVCRRQFDSILFYYHHLKTQASCRVLDNSDVSHSSDAINVSPSSLSDSESCNDVNRDWTCRSCENVYSGDVSKIHHYLSCKSKKSRNALQEHESCFKCVLSSECDRDTHRHSCEQILKHMTTAKVVLQRLQLPPHLIQNMKESTLDEVNGVPEPLMIKRTSVQKCVWCHRKCRYNGVGLPPIGQLACFQCRAKLFKKDLKKKGENFYSRAVFSEEEHHPVSQLSVETATNFVYLDPSKRLKVARALAKEKKNNPDISSQHIPLKWKGFELLNVLPLTVIKDNPIPISRSERCAHCKRGFASKEMLRKHVEVSKTCLLSERSPLKTTAEQIAPTTYNSNGSGTQSTNATSVSSEQSLRNEQSISSSQNGTSSSSKDSLLSDGDHTYSNQSNDVLPVKKAANCLYSNVTSNTSSKELGDMISKRGFLVLQDLDKALKTYPQVKRVRTSPALQCDGWILRPEGFTRDDTRVKYICGACYKSFSQNDVLADHITSMHNRPQNLVTKLNIMKHIPREVLNNVTW